MAKDTGRDKVWSYAMQRAINDAEYGDHEIKLKYVRNNIVNPPSDRTIRDVLNTMAQQGWLQKEKPQSRTWRAGEALRHVELEELPGPQTADVNALWE
jgi:hypothetical protein